MSRFKIGDIIKIFSFDKEIHNHYIIHDTTSDGLQVIFRAYSVFAEDSCTLQGSELYNYVTVDLESLLEDITTYNERHKEDTDVPQINVINVITLIKTLKDNK